MIIVQDNKQDEVQVISYQMHYYKLTAAMAEEDRELYDFVLLCLRQKALDKGFLATNVTKATKNGTKIRFEAVPPGKAYQESALLTKEIADSLPNVLKKLGKAVENE